MLLKTIFFFYEIKNLKNTFDLFLPFWKKDVPISLIFQNLHVRKLPTKLLFFQLPFLIYSSRFFSISFQDPIYWFWFSQISSKECLFYWNYSILMFVNLEKKSRNYRKSILKMWKKRVFTFCKPYLLFLFFLFFYVIKILLNLNW